MRLEPGTIFAKDYEVVAPLSQGGMGTIYVVQQLSTGRRRALKLMLPEFVHNASLRTRFEQEAKVASRIESDHVVQVIAAGIDEASGCPWLAMELLKGQTLEQRVAQGGLLSPVEIGQIFTQLCHGLRAAHAVGVVHRDLKPENIFLAEIAREGGHGLVKILDFGIARISAESKATKTAAMGTPLWMAPEQSKAGSSIGPATDIWALGLIAFWMIAGREYWLSAASNEVTPLMLMNEVLMQPLEPASVRAAGLGGRAVPEGFDAWFSRAVNRDMSQRFGDVDSALRELMPLLARMPGGVPAHSPSVEGFLVQGRIGSPESAYQATPTPAGVDAGRISDPNAPQRPSGTLIGAPLSLPAEFTQQGTQTPMPGATSMPGTAPGAFGTEPGPRGSSPSFGTDVRGSAPGWNQFQQPQAGYPNASTFHAPTGAPITTSAPNAAALPKPSKAPLFAGLAVAAIAVLGIGGWAVSKAIHKTGGSGDASGECSSSDLDACEKACNDAKDKDDGSAAGVCSSYAHALVQKGKADKAAPVLQKLCDDKPGAACDELGSLYAFSSKATRNEKKAASLFQRACDADVMSGCAHLGAAMELGFGDGNAAKAVPLYQKACDKGDGRGCVYLAAATAAGRGTAPDQAKAESLRKKAKADLDKRCKEDDAEACALGGVVRELSGDPGGARDSYRSACEAGDSLGCNNLARMDAEGVGGSADGDGAKKRFDELCAAGDAVACDNAGIIESRWSAQLRYGPRGEAAYKFKCAQAMNTGCSGWGEGKIVPGGSGDLTKAVASLTKACDGGFELSCVNLGGLLFIGQGAKKDRLHAHELFNKACDAGDPTGCGEAGSLYFVDYAEQPADFNKAVQLMQKGCEGGELDACSLVLRQKVYGMGTTKALGEALIGLKQLCEDKKIQQACGAYGDALLEDARNKPAGDASIAAEQEKAKKLYSDLCDATGEGCLSFAQAFEPDPKARFTLFQKGCDKGQFDACSELAAAYEDGKGVEKNAKTAQQIFEKACQRGHAASCGRLAVFYLEGSTPEDQQKGAQLSKDACDDGDPRGCGNYGTCLATGTGVEKNPAGAAPYLKRACAQGIQNACDTLQTVPH